MSIKRPTQTWPAIKATETISIVSINFMEVIYMYYEELKRWNQRWNLQDYMTETERDANGGDGNSEHCWYTDADVNKIPK